MENQILDYFGEFEENAQIVTVKYFPSEQEARLFAIGLRKAGIRYFVSNTNISTALPLGGIGSNGVGLHVMEDDLAEASRIVASLERKLYGELPNQSFHDADLDEIAYQRALHQSANPRTFRLLFWGLIILILLLLLRAYLRASGLAPSWWDFF